MMRVRFSDTYAGRIGAELAAARREGLDFELAWEQATFRTQPDTYLPPVRTAKGEGRPDDLELDGFLFLRDHMRAAFEDGDSDAGRLRIPRPDVMATTFRVPVPSAHVEDVPRCKSGDGCDREATRGRFGPMWCDHHGAELQRLWAVPGEGLRTTIPKAA